MKKGIDHDGNGLVGYTDYGGIIPNDESDKEATTALFIMATQINGRHKFPIAYLLTNGLSAGQLASVINTCLRKMYEYSSRVLSIAFDGLHTNLRAATILGANLDVESEEFSPMIPHPDTLDDVYIVLDPSHMVKLIRNFWSSSGVFLNGDGKEIRWQLVEKLHSIQTECGLRLANKLTSRHVQFQNQKMKTKLCVQVLSNSVAIALGVCRELDVEGFEDTEATEEFLKIIDRLFDILNSKSSGKGWKAPLRARNTESWSSFFTKCRQYFSTLKVLRKGRMVPILKTAKKDGTSWTSDNYSER
ncbi:DNA transposase THAP9 [Orchesella cincta]|uniref:DNA transposase THAP9 n=1 Tax=Orchesella cincta TaxID=48709 RepID=A0A1D2M1C0_ORCCI|nr:DNA transposase THAP9 [Orchesella cincta]